MTTMTTAAVGRPLTLEERNAARQQVAYLSAVVDDQPTTLDAGTLHDDWQREMTFGVLGLRAILAGLWAPETDGPSGNLESAESAMRRVAPLTDLQADVAAWRAETFPNATPASTFRHLEHEVDELELELLTNDTYPEINPKRVGEELADLVLLCIGLADAVGVNLGTAVADKHRTNRGRTWAYDPDLGYTRSVTP